MTATTAPFEPLPTDECYRLLRQVPFGRVVGTAAALPMVLPVNFALDGHGIVFRTTPDSTLAGATSGQVVAFEADHLDPVTRTGWSVVVIGTASAVTEVSDQLRLAQLNLVSWLPGPRHHWVRITPGIVTGRRLHGPQPAVPLQPAATLP
jgi:uncharacterized protein